MKLELRLTEKGDRTMQNQNSKKKVVLPQVRYHPSIQNKTSTTRAKPLGSRPGIRSNEDSEESVLGLSLAPVHDTDPKGAVAPPSAHPVVGSTMDRFEVEEVEVLTRGQRTNPAWFSWRRNRITASIAHQIAHSQFANSTSKTPPLSYLSAITGEGQRVQTRAMEWGNRMEAEAVRSYQKLQREVAVVPCGLFVDPRRPWLAASPDGIVTDRVSGRRLRCLEVKCPYKHRHRRLEDVCREQPDFCLEILHQESQKPPVYRLKPSHNYFTQVQVQMAVTNLSEADFVVYTLKETAIVTVTFDPLLWEDTLSKLERFYRDAVLPHIKAKTKQVRTVEL